MSEQAKLLGRSRASRALRAQSAERRQTLRSKEDKEYLDGLVSAEEKPAQVACDGNKWFATVEERNAYRQKRREKLARMRGAALGMEYVAPPEVKVLEVKDIDAIIEQRVEAKESSVQVEG